MSKEDYNRLQELFEKLEGHIGHRICLISGPCDGSQIAAYEPNGTMIESSTSFDIKTAAEMLKRKLQKCND